MLDEKLYEFTYAPDPTWCRIVEYYCPQCGTLIENEYLPPGHPLTHDIELDIDKLKERHLSKEGQLTMRRVSVDIGGTFTDCFLACDEHYVESEGADHAPQPRHGLHGGARRAPAPRSARRSARCSATSTRCATRRRWAPTR